jgi:hypothetical protein
MKEQTAVEWLEEEIGRKNMGTYLEGKIKISREMELENIKQAYEDGKLDAYRQDDVPTADEYVYQRYGHEKL